MRCVPLHRSIVAIDIERSTAPGRTNPIRAELRDEVYRLLGEALRTAGIADRHCDPPTDRGDGVLVLVHPADDVPKTLLLNPLIPALVSQLAQRNASLDCAERGRLATEARTRGSGEIFFSCLFIDQTRKTVPMNSRIITAVKHPAMTASRTTPLIAPRTNTD